MFLGDFERHIVQNLDGTRDRAALIRLLTELVNKGELNVEKDGQPVKDEKQLSEMIGTALDSQLQVIAGNALLVR